MKSGGGVGSRTPIAVSPKVRTWQFKTTSSASVKYKYLWMSFHNDRPLSCGAFVGIVGVEPTRPAIVTDTLNRKTKIDKLQCQPFPKFP